MAANGGWRLVRWVGDPIPWDDPAIQRALAQGRLSLGLTEWFRHFATYQANQLVPGRMTKTLGPAHGFGQTYTFGPDEYRAWMTDADAALLFGNEWDRWQFLDVTDAPGQTQRPPMGKRDWQSLQASFAKLTEFRRLKPEYR